MPDGEVMEKLSGQIADLRVMVERVLGKVDAISEKITTLDLHRVDLEKRVRDLESFRWKLTGAALLTGAASGGVAALLAQVVTK